jgi:membrane protease YdiL (CAAX protease family)
MNLSVSSEPLVKAGWLRTLLYILALMLAAGTVLIAFILGMHKGNPDASGLQELMKGNNPALIVLILFILVLLITVVFRRWVDRKSFISLGLEIKGHGFEAMAGAALAVFIMGSSCLIIQATGHLKWMDILFDPKSLFLAFGTILLSAFYEELIFRGYILNNLMDSFPKWPALGISTLLFMVFHWNSAGLFPVLNVLMLGGITGLFYLYTRNLWFPICFHAAWKFMAGPVLGFSNDQTSQTLLQTSLQGNENITGGATGLQGSVILLSVSLFSAVALYFILQKKLSPKSQPVPGRI